MPLDHEKGEKLDGLPGEYVVIPTRVLAGLSNVHAVHEYWSGPRRMSKTMPIFDDAVSHAMQAFMKAGSVVHRAFDDEDVLVQVYPKERKVAVIFQRKVAGEDRYFWRQYDLSEDIVTAILGLGYPATLLGRFRRKVH